MNQEKLGDALSVGLEALRMVPLSPTHLPTLQIPNGRGSPSVIPSRR